MTPELTLTESGPAAGRPVLVPHGGGRPATVAPIAEHIAAPAHTLPPTHPRWNGPPRPRDLTRVPDVAAADLRLRRERRLSDVLVIGASRGGWIAAELATADTQGLIGGVVLVNSVGIEVDGEPVRDFFTLDARGVAEYAYHDSERFYVDPATV